MIRDASIAAAKAELLLPADAGCGQPPPPVSLSLSLFLSLSLSLSLSFFLSLPFSLLFLWRLFVFSTLEAEGIERTFNFKQSQLYSAVDMQTARKVRNSSTRVTHRTARAHTRAQTHVHSQTHALNH